MGAASLPTAADVLAVCERADPQELVDVMTAFGWNWHPMAMARQLSATDPRAYRGAAVRLEIVGTERNYYAEHDDRQRYAVAAAIRKAVEAGEIDDVADLLL